MKSFWIGVTLCGLLFGILFVIRLGFFNRSFTAQRNHSNMAISALSERDTWMNIFQKGHKIGYSHTTFIRAEKGYLFKENINMRINTMGLVQDINLKTSGKLNPDYTLSAFDFEIGSGRFHFMANGTILKDILSIQTQNVDSTQRIEIKLKEKIYMVPALLDAVTASGIKPGDEYSLQVFDPATLGQETVHIRVVGKEDILSMGKTKRATKVLLIFKGITQTAWMGEQGGVLKEKGILGISLERTTRDEALYGLPVESSQDLTMAASIPSNLLIDDARTLVRLDVEIGGIQFDDVDLKGGRQTLNRNVLRIVKESLADLPAVIETNSLLASEKKYLEPTLFIQSDHPKIKKLTRQIVSAETKPLKKVHKLVDWIQDNIEKRPVLSLPDALSTLQNRMGDCNEHAVLLAALSRAAGIPAKIEAGLVYLNGRFYYHAWNLLYLGRWITVDPLFGQIPADVTHIRFSSGSQKQQLDLMSIIGKIKLIIVDYKQ
ncbi:MAG: transglutaminase-like domain-containing protein [Proteobacteria bacterium]|nr:transglutaminase-like domain-containing protein [Pseudomonadota bacterium]